MMNDLATVSPLALPLTISFDDLLDADESENTMTWTPDPDAAVTTVMPAVQPDETSDVRSYFERCGLPFMPSVVLSITMVTGIVAAIVATSL